MMNTYLAIPGYSSFAEKKYRMTVSVESAACKDDFGMVQLELKVKIECPAEIMTKKYGASKRVKFFQQEAAQRKGVISSEIFSERFSGLILPPESAGKVRKLVEQLMFDKIECLGFNKNRIQRFYSEKEAMEKVDVLKLAWKILVIDGQESLIKTAMTNFGKQ
jgi:hypothetical protein